MQLERDNLGLWLRDDFGPVLRRQRHTRRLNNFALLSITLNLCGIPHPLHGSFAIPSRSMSLVFGPVLGWSMASFDHKVIFICARSITGTQNNVTPLSLLERWSLFALVIGTVLGTMSGRAADFARAAVDIHTLFVLWAKRGKMPRTETDVAGGVWCGVLRVNRLGTLV